MTGIGLSIAIVMFWALRQFFFEPDSNVGDIISATATAMGALTIGGIATIQYRKHRWAEKQAQSEIETRTGERLGQAIEHLGSDTLHIKLGAVYEFNRLAQDSPRDKESIVQILTAFIKSHKVVKDEDLPQDVEAAARILSQLIRMLIEETARTARKRNRFRFYKVKGAMDERIHRKMFSKIRLFLPLCVYNATDAISALGKKNIIELGGLQASYLEFPLANLYGANLFQANLKGANFNRANLTAVNLSEANLENANLDGTELVGALLIATNLKDASLSWTNLTGAEIGGTNFKGAHLIGTNFQNSRIDGIRPSKNTQPVNTNFVDALITKHTKFDPGVREKYFPDFKPNENTPDS